MFPNSHKWLSRLSHDIQFREIISGSSISLCFKILGSLSTFVFNLLLARTFGAAEAGLFFLSLAVAEVFAIVGRLGLAQSIIAFIGGESAQKNWRAVKGAFKKSLLIMTISSLLAGILMLLLSIPLAKTAFDEPNLAPLFHIMAFAVPAMAFLHLIGNSLQALNQIRESQFIVSLSLQLLLIICISPILFQPDIMKVPYAYAIAVWISTIGAFFLLWLNTPQLRNVSGNFPYSKIISKTIPLFWSNLLIMLNARAGTFLLGYLASPFEVGVYNIAFRISMLINFVLFAVNAICTPKFASFHATGDKKSLANVARQSTLIIVVTTLPILLIIIFFSNHILTLFGTDFAENNAPLVVLAIGQCVNIAVGPVGMLLAMSGKEKQLRNVYIICTPLNIFLQFALIPHLGALGASIATAISIIFQNITAFWLVKKELNIDIFSISLSFPK